MTNLLNKLKGLKLDNKKIFIIAFVGVLILYIDFAFIMKLQLQGIRTLTPKIIKLKKDFDNLAKDLSWMHDLGLEASKDKAQIGAPNKAKEIISEDRFYYYCRRYPTSLM